MDAIGIFFLCVMAGIVLLFVGLVTGLWGYLIMVLFHKPMRPFVAETVRSLVHNSDEWKVSICGVRHKSDVEVYVTSIGWEYIDFWTPKIDSKELTRYERWKLSRACRDWERITGKKLRDKSSTKDTSKFVEAYEQLKR